LDGLYNAGHLTIAAIFNKLKQETKLDEATEVFLAGGSAGGIGVFVNANYIKSILPKTTAFRVHTNAGWFQSNSLPMYNTTYVGDQFEIVYSQAKSYLDPSCTAVNTARPWDCFAGNFEFPHLTMPIFVANSIFDYNALQIQAGVDSTPANNWADPYANLYIIKSGQIANDTLVQVYNKPDAGLYSTSAWVHGLSICFWSHDREVVFWGG
jgi:hypothetical protein